MRTIWAALGLALTILGFASGASAQNGLQRFESEIKPQIELKKFTYGSAYRMTVLPGNPKDL